MSMATLALWVGNSIVGQMTPWLLENINPFGTFWLFSILMFPAIYLVFRVLPETKGKTLEEIEKYWISIKTK